MQTKYVGVKGLSKRFLNVIQENKVDTSGTIPVQVSTNSKTEASINVAIVGSCMPTKQCEQYCYGSRGPIAFKHSLIVQAKNLARFNHLESAAEAEVEQEARNIMKQVGAASWFRWNGVGDLVPGSVRVINAIARLYPKVTQWVVTRKPAMARLLSDSASISVLFSLDNTTPAKVKAEALVVRAGFKKTLFQFSWTQTSETDLAPAEVSIVFNNHTGRKRQTWNDARVCEATQEGKNHDNACNDCRRCFEKQ
jgi:hypothetical protein